MSAGQGMARNHPALVAQLRPAFDAYERALMADDPAAQPWLEGRHP